MNNLKKCSICKEEKLLTEFNKNKSNNDGLDYVCKCCRKEFNKKSYFKKNPKKRDKSQKKQNIIDKINKKLNEFWSK